MKPLLHHPDVSWTVLRRRSADLFVDLVRAYGDFVVTRGHSLVWNHCFPSRTAYFSALSRLRRSGVLVSTVRRDGTRVLHLGPRAGTPETGDIRARWARRWDGIWRVLVYDIPENQRAFRNAFRQLLRRLRMGCLQGSVWVSPDDIRAEYADLAGTLNIDFMAFLFESRTVLMRSAQDVVLQAWDFGRLGDLHTRYVNLCWAGLERLKRGAVDSRDLMAFAGEELFLFRECLHRDPQLPRALHPASYRGAQVLDCHEEALAVLRKAMKQL